MKKHLLTAVLMAASISLAGCNGNNPKPQPSGEAESSAQETEAESADGSENSGEASESTEGKEEKAANTEKKSEPIKLPDFDFTKENFPRLDGSTSTVPLGKTLTSALLGISEKEAEDFCVFNRTTQSFRNLLAGEADMLIVGEPNAKVFQEMADAGFKYRIEDFATDALIFVVNKDNPVDNLTTDQIRDIYSGKITNWKEVGGNDAEIKAFQRNEGAGSQALILKHIMKDTPMVTPPSSLVASEMGELMTAVKSYDNSANAIGYSVYYYANDMEKAKGLKIISVDGVKPEPATIREKKYPHRNAYYAVIPEETDPADNRAKAARVIYDWIMSVDGQRLVASKGYVSVMDVSMYDDKGVEAKPAPEANYTRLNDAPEGTLTSVEPGGDYGLLLPYCGSPLVVDVQYGEDESYSYIGGYMCGFFDTKGRLITDPVYNSIEVLSYYDPADYNEFYLPYYEVCKYDPVEGAKNNSSDEIDVPDENIHRQLISPDGSFVSPEYGYISGMKDHVLCKANSETNDFVIYDNKGNIVLDYKTLDEANDGKLTELLNDTDSLYDVSYGDGYYVFYLYDSYYYIDENDHKIAMGPFQYAQPFTDGTAFARKDDSAVIINKYGDNILGNNYVYADKLKNGNMLGVAEDHVDVIDPKGYLIKTIDGFDSSGVYQWGFYASKYTEDSRWRRAVFDNDGNELFRDDDDSWQYCDKIPVAYATGTEDGPNNSYEIKNTGVWLMNVQTGKRIFIKGADYANAFYTLNGVADVPYIAVSSYDDTTGKNHQWMYDENLNELMDYDGYVNVVSDNLTNEWLFLGSEDYNDSCRIYNKDLKVILETKAYPYLYDGYASFFDGDSYACVDKKGNEIFRYVMTSLGDD